MTRIPSRIREYDVHFHDDLAFVGALEAKEPLWVIDAKVHDLWKDRGLALDESRSMRLDAVEQNKSLASVKAIWDWLLERGARRSTTLVSVGGGIVQDVTGFATSQFHRGMRWVYVPTTLLAQADSCVGSKTSLNYEGYKNLLGGFYPPHEIHIAPRFLDTLGDPDYFSGLGEVAKLALIGGEARVQSLAAALPALVKRVPDAALAAIRASLEVKLPFLAEDEFDRGRRQILNYGHCFGHALESASQYAIPHGQAVLAGMLFANDLSRSRGLLAEADEQRARRILLELWRVRPLASHLDAGPICEAMSKDKKRSGTGLTVILAKTGWDFVKADDVGASEVEAAIGTLRRALGTA